jgi:hypothetical protein
MFDESITSLEVKAQIGHDAVSVKILPMTPSIFVRLSK